jgi:membrane-bound serine protease (ClpP class)
MRTRRPGAGLDGLLIVFPDVHVSAFVRAWSLVIATLIAVGVLGAASSQALTPRVLHIELEGVVNPIKARYIARALRDVESKATSLVLLTINTPGGLVSSMQDIVQAITSCKVPVVGLVTPSAAQATSAGALVLLATDVAAMLPDTRVGAAHPVGAGEPLEGAIEEKATNSLASLAKSLAARRGRSEQAAEAMVRESVSYTADEAREKKVIELVASDARALLDQLHGRRLDFADRHTVLATRGATITDVPLSSAERILDALADPTLASILLSIGVLGILYELAAPGIGLGGIAGVISLVLGLLAMSVLPVRISGILLLVAGLIAIALEVKTPAHGMLGFGGLLAIVVGALVLVDETRYFGALQQIRWRLFVPVVALCAVAVLALAKVAAQAQRPPPRTGLEALPGTRGHVDAPIVRSGATHAGSVRVDGVRWQAVSEAEIAEHETIEVEAVLTQPTRLKVKRVPDGDS